MLSVALQPEGSLDAGQLEVGTVCAGVRDPFLVNIMIVFREVAG